MFRISPSKKDAATAVTAAVPLDPVTKWTQDHNFAFPPALTFNDYDVHHHQQFKEIRELPKVGYPLYHLISQYNPWLDCEMTREKRAFLAPRVGEFCCPVYVGSAVDHFFRNDTVVDIVNLYLWSLLHSRADEVVACRTFADWRRLFTQTISLAFPDYEYWCSVASAGAGAYAVSSTFIPVSDQRRTARILKYMTPARVLYLLTTRAGFWPYGGSAQQYGICSVKPKIKEYTDKTKIDWLVTANFLRKMKRVHVYFTTSITTHSNAGVSSSVYDTTDDDE
jgi:hypothetical protein